MKKVKTRIAPSPTWWLHLGTARVALYNWLFAKQHGGEFLIRIEDTDLERSKKEYERDILAGLRWLGLKSDNEIEEVETDIDIPHNWRELLEKYESVKPDEFKSKWRQTQRLPLYRKFIYKLLKEGKAYFAWETSEELKQMRDDAQRQKRPFVYRQIDYSSKQIEEFKRQWRKPVVRFKIPSKQIKYYDLVKWEISFDGNLVGDIVIVKSDGIPTFLFSNVVDDFFMGITHVIRGEDHVPNMPKQLPIYEALGWEIPQYGHLPLLLNKDKTKMSKRSENVGLVFIKDFKEEGFLPQALVNYFALLWWHPSWDREFFDVEELLKEFSLDRVQSSNAVYDYQRALWMNWEYIRNLEDAQFVEILQNYLKEYGDEQWWYILEAFSIDYWLKLTPFIKVRLQTLRQFRDYGYYFFQPQYPSKEILLNPKMKVSMELIREILPDIIKILEDIEEGSWTLEILKENLLEFVKSRWLKNGQVLWPVRAILTWVEASPWAFEMLYVLGKRESLKRLKHFYNIYIKKYE